MAAPEGYKALGKIGISYKGDYNLNTVYERLDAVYHNGSTYLAIKDAPDGAPRNDKINWIYLAKGYDGETVDVAESEIVFTESETRENIGSGEKVSTVFGKIKKFFTDLTAPAFAQMITTKEDLLATKVTGYVPDAKAVADGFADVNGKLSTEHTILYSNYFAANVTNNITLNDDFKNYKTLFFVCNNGTAALYCPTIYPASYIKKLYESTKNTQYLGTYPSINTFIGSAQSSAFIPIADNKFKLTTYTSGTFFVIGLK